MPRWNAIAFWGLALLPGSIAAQSDSLAPVSAHLKAVTTMQAGFTQTDQRGRTLTGQLSLKRPGKIRFQYQKGVPTLVVANGSSLYYIDYSVKQVQRWPIGNSPLGVLLNPNTDLARFAKMVPSNDPRIVVVQVRDPKRFPSIAMVIVMDKSGSMGALENGAQKMRLAAEAAARAVELLNEDDEVTVYPESHP